MHSPALCNTCKEEAQTLTTNSDTYFTSLQPCWRQAATSFSQLLLTSHWMLDIAFTLALNWTVAAAAPHSKWPGPSDFHSPPVQRCPCMRQLSTIEAAPKRNCSELATTWHKHCTTATVPTRHTIIPWSQSRSQPRHQTISAAASCATAIAEGLCHWRSLGCAKHSKMQVHQRTLIQNPQIPHQQWLAPMAGWQTS